MSNLQVFFWTGQGQRKESENRTYYSSFSLNGHSYTTGECVFLFPEDEKYPHYIGRIEKAFVDESSSAADPHCIEVRWYERRINLETSTKGIEESEREVFELEEKDVNPIGCISGKCYVTKAPSYEEACKHMAGTPGDWFFCRGYFLQHTNSFKAYDQHELADNHHPLPPQSPAVPVGGARPLGHASHAVGAPESSRAAAGVVRRAPGPAQPQQQQRPASGPGSGAAAPRAAGTPGGSKARGSAKVQVDRVCVECGATTTPQWREGPKGPKTLCNACGVRYVRAQQKARGKGVPAPQQKNGSSSLGNSPVPQTQHSRATSSQGVAPTEQRQAAQDGNALLTAARRVLRTLAATSTTTKHAATAWQALPAHCCGVLRAQQARTHRQRHARCRPQR